ncbi:transcription termination factor 2 [Diachasma alloeum]|uniref:transcription termination factor 2 n=1 Tax=Diachasma alloeum TaxID=454923 RepID=UPI0007383F77|nr:transcription termination factor 2 [Diachasma alloeum]
MEDSFFVEDTDDEDTLSTQRVWQETKASHIIPDSDDEFLNDDSDNEVPEGRMTPSIQKAIRRSIFNITHQMTDSDEEEVEEEDEEEAGTDEDEHKSLERSRELNTSDSEDEEFIPTQKKRLNRIVDSSDNDSPIKSRHEVSHRSHQKSSDFRTSHLDSSYEDQERSHEKSDRRSASLITSIEDLTSKEHEEDPDSGRSSNPKDTTTLGLRKTSRTSRSLKKTPRHSTHSRVSDSFIIENSSSDEEASISKSKPKKLEVRPQYIISSDEGSNSVRAKEIISIDSDTPSDSDVQREEQNRSTGEAAALSYAQQELGLKNVDPLMAQRRALLAIELQKKELELAKMMTFIDSGKVELLPDKGKKFLDRASETEAQVHHIRKQLAECRLVEEEYHTSPKVTTPSSVENYPYTLSPSPLQIPKTHRPQDPEYIPSDSDEDVPPTPKHSHLLNRPTTAPIGELGRKALETFEREQALTVETLKSFHGSLNSRPGEDEQAEDPRGLKVPLMAHQKHALAWMAWRENQNPPGGVLADDMGLGKTLTMISLVLKSMDSEDSGGESEGEWRSKQRSSKPTGGTLVVCPASLIGQWEEEVKRRCKKGLLNVEVYHGTKRENIPKRLAKNDLVITTYNLLSREHKVNGVLLRIGWKRVILDEGHVIRNHKSQVCEAVCALEAKNRWVLTGTPIHNKEMDLFSVLKFLQCSPFNDIRVWKRWVDNKNQAGHDRLATVMKTLMLRRTKEELMNSGAVENLPDKMFEIIWVELDPEERVVYDKVMLYSKTIFAQFLHQRAEKEHMFRMGAGYYDRRLEMSKNPFNKAQQRLLAQHADVKSHQILTLFLRLRQICCHPSLINAMLDQEDIEQTGLEDLEAERLAHRMGSMRINALEGDEDVPDGPAEVDDRVSEHLLTSENPVFERDRESSKLRAVLNLLQEILKKDEKVIIVSQWTSVLNIIAENLTKIKKATFKSLTGEVQVKDRGAIVDSFNYEKDPRVLLLSLTAGGVGLNLVGANHLMLVDIHWNPQLESQAQDRIYRFGQKKNVFIYKFLCTDTIEEKIKSMQDDKLELAKTVLSGGGKAKSAKLTMDDLRTIFGL